MTPMEALIWFMGYTERKCNLSQEELNLAREAIEKAIIRECKKREGKENVR